MKSATEWPAASVEMRAISSLVPYARNSRTHSVEQIDQIAASMREWGWTNPVLVDETGMIIAGHGRILAAQKLDLTDAPVMTARGWSEGQKRAYVIADNKLALNAGWDMAALSAEITDLQVMGADLASLGFTAKELGELTADPRSGLPELADRDRQPFQQMTFTLHDSQVETVKAAMDKARDEGPYDGSPNENGNGNALARICEAYLG